jgi:hypothetical protein
MNCLRYFLPADAGMADKGADPGNAGDKGPDDTEREELVGFVYHFKCSGIS